MLSFYTKCHICGKYTDSFPRTLEQLLELKGRDRACAFICGTCCTNSSCPACKSAFISTNKL